MKVRNNRLLSVYLSFYQKMFALSVNNNIFKCEHFFMYHICVNTFDKKVGQKHHSFKAILIDPYTFPPRYTLVQSCL